MHMRTIDDQKVVRKVSTMWWNQQVHRNLLQGYVQILYKLGFTIEDTSSLKKLEILCACEDDKNQCIYRNLVSGFCMK